MTASQTSDWGARAPAVRAAAKRCRRRLLLQDAQRLSARFVSVGGAAGLALLLWHRLVWPVGDVPALALLAAPVLLAAALAVGRALARAPSKVDALRVLDERLGLEDQLTSGALLAAEEDAFAKLTTARAERLARGAVVKRAAPMRLDAWWTLALGAAAAGGAALLWTPDLAAQARLARQTQQQALEQKREETLRRLRRMRELVEAPAPAETQTEEQPALTAEGVDTLQAIEEALERGELSPDRAALTAARTAQRLTQEQERRAREGELMRRALAERFAGLSPLRESSGEASSQEAQRALAALRRALAQGDAREAAQAWERFSDTLARSRGASEDESAALARDLASLRNELEELRRRDAADPSDDAAAPLTDAGVSPEKAQQLLEEHSDPESLRKALEQEGFDPLAAERLAEEALEQQQRAAAQRQAEEAVRALQHGVEEAERKARSPEDNDSAERSPAEARRRPEHSAQQQQVGEDTTRSEQPSGAPEQTPQGQRTGSQRSEAQERSARRSVDQSSEEGPRRERSDSDKGAAERQDQPPTASGADSSSKEGEKSGGRRGADSSSPEGAPNAAERNGGDEGGRSRDKGAAERPASGAAPTPGPAAEERRGMEPSSSGEGAPSPSAPPAGAMEQARKTLERLAQEAQRSEEARKRLRRLQEQARKLLEGLDESQRDQLRKLAEGMQRGASGGAAPREGDRTSPQAASPSLRQELVDLRQGRASGDGARAPLPKEQGGASRPGPSPSLTKAAPLEQALQRVRRALEDRAVPLRRRETVKRYFDRLRAMAVERGRQAPDAPDAAPQGRADGDARSGGR